MIPRKIALLTDSCADLPPALAAENQIHVVPLRILNILQQNLLDVLKRNAALLHLLRLLQIHLF